MANKKITVVGDGAEEPMSPEEEHRLEAKVDQMLDPNLPDTQAAPIEKVNSDPRPRENVAPPELPTASAPKVTKIVTKFADEEDTQPSAPIAENPKEKAKPEAIEEPVEKPKATVKKIAIKQHDEEKPAKPKKPAGKHVKAKVAPRKSVKKLKVTVADGSESEDLDSKADAITAAALAAEAQLVTEKKPTEKTELETEEPKAVEPIIPEVPETTKNSDNGAPPLIKKHSRAPIGVTDGEEVASVEPTPETPKPLVSKKISVLHDETDEDLPNEIAEEPVIDSEIVPEQAKVTEIQIDEPEEVAETISVEVESEAEVASSPKTTKAEESNPATSDTRKYRPPEGPIQFKRAEVPIQPHKPGEPRPVDTAPAELNEDAAIAQAFETKPSKSNETFSTLGSSLRRVLKWTLASAFVLGLLAVAGLPSLRHKALGLIGVNTTSSVNKAQTSKTPAPAKNAEPVANDVYLSKRSGIYNLYRNSIDGQQEQLVLAGTGNETSSIAIAPNASSQTVALVSTRDNKKGSSGNLQQSLSLVTVEDGKVNAIDSADQIKLVDWFGDRVVYVLLNTNASTTDTNRYQIVSYNTSSKTRLVLDHATYLNDVLSAEGTVYYATGASGQFASIQPDGSAKQIILNGEIAAITRTSYDKLILSGINKWYAYKLGEKQAAPTNNIGQGTSRLYSTSPDGKKAVYIKSAGAITVLDITSGKETSILASNASYPLHWLNNQTVVYRSGEGDYAVKLDGTQPLKIADVADVPGISLWHEK